MRCTGLNIVTLQRSSRQWEGPHDPSAEAIAKRTSSLQAVNNSLKSINWGEHNGSNTNNKNKNNNSSSSSRVGKENAEDQLNEQNAQYKSNNDNSNNNSHNEKSDSGKASNRSITASDYEDVDSDHPDAHELKIYIEIGLFRSLIEVRFGLFREI